MDPRASADICIRQIMTADVIIMLCNTFTTTITMLVGLYATIKCHNYSLGYKYKLPMYYTVELDINLILACTNSRAPTRVHSIDFFE